MNSDKNCPVEKRYCFNPVKPRTWLIENLRSSHVEVFSLKTESNTDAKDDMDIIGYSANDFHYLKINHDLALYNWRSNCTLLVSGYFKKCLPFIRAVRFIASGQSEMLFSVDIERRLTNTSSLQKFMPEYFKLVKLELQEIGSPANTD